MRATTSTRTYATLGSRMVFVMALVTGLCACVRQEGFLVRVDAPDQTESAIRALTVTTVEEGQSRPQSIDRFDVPGDYALPATLPLSSRADRAVWVLVTAYASDSPAAEAIATGSALVPAGRDARVLSSITLVPTTEASDARPMVQGL